MVMDSYLGVSMQEGSPWAIRPELHQCPLSAPEHVEIHKAVSDKVKALNNKFPHIEWLVYAIGVRDEQGVHLTDVVIPKQVITPVSVQVLEYPQDITGIIGTIHSHHSMGAFFSGTDETFLMGNHKVTVVVSDGEFKCSTRVQSPCGNMCNMDSTIIFCDQKLQESVPVRRAPLDSFVRRIFGIQDKIGKTEVVPELDFSNIMTQQEYNRTQVEAQSQMVGRPVEVAISDRKPETLWERLKALIQPKDVAKE